MDRYSKGMQDGANPFVDYFSDKSAEMSERQKDIEENIENLREDFDLFFDYIEIPEEDKTFFLEESLRKRKSRKRKATKFNLKLVYQDKKDMEMVTSIKSIMSKCGNGVIVEKYEDYKKNTKGTADCIFFIGNDASEEDDWIEADKIYDYYGCEIKKVEVHGCENILVLHDEKFDFADHKDDFIQYYESQVNKIKSESKETNRMKKALEKREKLKAEKGKISKEVEKWTDSFMDRTVNSKVLDKMEDLAEQEGLIGKIGEIGYGALVIGAVIGSVIVEISGLLYGMIDDSLADAIMESDFKKEIVAEAQRQLLSIKVVEYMERKMLEDVEYDKEQKTNVVKVECTIGNIGSSNIQFVAGNYFSLNYNGVITSSRTTQYDYTTLAPGGQFTTELVFNCPSATRVGDTLNMTMTMENAQIHLGPVPLDAEERSGFAGTYMSSSTSYDTIITVMDNGDGTYNITYVGDALGTHRIYENVSLNEKNKFDIGANTYTWDEVDNILYSYGDLWGETYKTEYYMQNPMK